MKAFEKTAYHTYEVSTAFNKIILSHIESYDGKKKKKLRLLLEDLQHGGCISGMIPEFINQADCKAFYTTHMEDLENMKNDVEDSFGDTIPNSFKNPHYTFMCWLCFEEYCHAIYSSIFDN